MRRRSFGPRPIVTSIKNSAKATAGLTGATNTFTFAKAVTSPSPTVASDVSHGCMIKAAYVTLDACGLGGTGVLNTFNGYLIKSPGANLALPLPISVGTSNEKKFIIKEWQGMIMRNQDGNAALHWEGWIKFPKRYHRMGTDDIWVLATQCSAGLTGHVTFSCIYKWYR